MSRNNIKKPARVLIVDDHPAVREALAMRIGRQSDLEVCGEAADVSEALPGLHICSRPHECYASMTA